VLREANQVVNLLPNYSESYVVLANVSATFFPHEFQAFLLGVIQPMSFTQKIT